MSEKEFLKIFDQLYGKDENYTFITKTPTSIMILSADNKNEKKHIGIGITPDITLGVRLIDDEKFYIRDTESEIVYSSDGDKLCEYNENNWTKNLFILIGKIKKLINIKGAELLFESECHDLISDEYYAAIIYAFINIFCLENKENEFKNILITENLSSEDKVYRYIEIASLKNNFIYIENNLFFRIPFNLDEYKFVVARVEKDIKRKKILSEDTIRLISMNKDELNLYQDLPEYNEAIYILNESKRISDAINFIKCNNIDALSDIINESAKEYMSIYPLSKNIKFLYDIMSRFSKFCHIYKEIGVYMLIKNENVDEAVKRIGKLFQEKIGFLPDFYICDTSGSKKINKM